MSKMFTVQDFYRRFPTDDACLDHLFTIRHGNPLNCLKCGRSSRFHRVRKRPVFECQWCGHQVSPMVGTPFEKSRTPLQKWFYAMYLFTTSRHGVAAKELQRQLGITYKAAWRMAHEIRKYMAQVDGNDSLGGHVEVDETVIGGYRPGKRGRAAAGKTVVMGLLERGGEAMTMVIPNVRRDTLQPIVRANVERGSTVHTDELGSYRGLGYKGYRHKTVNHSKGEYVKGNSHVNGIEGYWSRLKNSIRGTHIHVSRQHLSKYLGEFEYRFNMRGKPEAMFARLLLSF
jgi:transposase-like protein